ncbi:unnamed protein product, partial [Porites evermanni]
AENCVERCHYTHVYRDKKCVTASPTTTPSTQSIGTGNPTSIPLTTVIPRTGSTNIVKPTTGKPVPPTRRPAKGKPTTMKLTAGKSSTMNITIGNPTSSTPTTGKQVTTGPASSRTKARQQGLCSCDQHPQNTTQIEGGNVTFTCDATTNPASSFLWTKDGSVVNATSTIILSSDNKQLTIINVSRGDSGHYTCVATNDVKTVQSNAALLDVQCKNESSVFLLSLEKKIFNRVTARFPSLFKCKHYKLIPSLLDQPNAPPFNVQGHNTSSTSILVQWGDVPAAAQNGIILRYTVTYTSLPGGSTRTKVVNSPTTKAILTGLNKYTNYSITVFASTSKGDGNVSEPIVVVTDESRPSAAPLLNSVTVLNSTSVLVGWECVPKEYRNGIITQYTIYYRDELKKAEGTRVVIPPNKTVIINGLRQKAEYLFWILAATSKGNGPPSNTIKPTTDAVPTILPPVEEAIGAIQASVKFVNKHFLSTGSPVKYFRMIVITLPKGAEPGNPADEKYQNVTRVYDDQLDGKPYITAEFEREESRTTFIVGDGKYYSRSGITDAERKRRATSYVTKYLNGKLKEKTEYVVFQRSFDKDGNYENEGFIQFATKKENDSESSSKPSTVIIVSVVIVLVILLLVGVAIIVWRYRRSYNESTCCSKRKKDKLSQENIEMSDNSKLSTSGGYYNSIQLHDELRSVERPAKTCQDTYEDVLSDEPTYYTDVNPDQERIYQEIKNENHYQPLDLNRPAVYEKSQGSSKIFM